MNLKNKFIFWSMSLMVLVLAVGSISIVNVLAFYRAAQATAAEYDAMDRAEGLLMQVAWLRDSLRGANAAAVRNPQYFTPIQKEVTEIIQGLQRASKVDVGDGSAEEDLGQSIGRHLDAAVQQSVDDDLANTRSSVQAADELNHLHTELGKVARLMPDSARRHVAVAADQLKSRLLWSCIWLLIALGVSAAVHVKQFQTLVRPLLWLRDDMRLCAAHDYKGEIRARGDREFKDVAAYFNGLARELAELYHGLEKKVIDRSRELVRSERLASVGFLAAGVAHEINNPLSVISGYAELAAKSLRGVLLGEGGTDAQAEAEAEALASALEAQSIIRDEAFRCKEITSRLLSLARGGNDSRQPLCLDDVARQVTVLTRGLKNYRDRRVVLEFNQADPLEIVANLTEMKQVLLNLTVNALEAVPADRGEVRIGGHRTGDWVELSVQDNGKGMSAETLERVFEPFFTAKRGAGEPGTGLGLSITHAIIENHGGRIRVESDGPGRGSRFTLRLPASSGLRAAAV